MSNMLGPPEGGVTGQMYQGPSLEEAHEQVDTLLVKARVAFTKYRDAQHVQHIADPEVAAHRAQVLANLAGEFAQAAYVLQRAAYLKATK